VNKRKKKQRLKNEKQVKRKETKKNEVGKRGRKLKTFFVGVKSFVRE
jgi:hypothetical protein